MRRFALALAAPGALLAALAIANEGHEAAPQAAHRAHGEEVEILDLPFSHPEHARVFEQKSVTCVTCHPVGLSREEALPRTRSSCHACHLREIDAAPHRADRSCNQCHTDMEPLVPANHVLNWMEAHGREARTMRPGCRDCHDPADCVTCHDMRGALTEPAHPSGFISMHGIEARLNPAKCSQCHVGATCTDCHLEGIPHQ
jgi:hypothetical protein